VFNEWFDLVNGLDDVLVSVDGVDVPVDRYWMTEDEIARVQAIVDGVDVLLGGPLDGMTPTEIQGVLDQLAGGQGLITSLKEPGRQVDKDRLGDALNRLDYLAVGLVESVDGAGVDRDQYWVTSEVMAGLMDAKRAAEVVMVDELATEAQVEQAMADVRTAMDRVSDTKLVGTGFATSDLQEAVDRAREFLDALKTSETNGADVARGEYWVTPGYLAELEQLMVDAEGAVGDPCGELGPDCMDDDMLEVLYQGWMDSVRGALDDLSAAKQQGRQHVADAIVEAEELLESVKVSVDGSDVAKDEKWVTEAEKDALLAEIGEAKELLEAEEVQSNLVNNMFDDVVAATETFEKAAEDGRQVDAADVGEALAEFEAALEDVVKSDDGTDVSPKDYWVTAGEKDPLDAVVTQVKDLLAKTDPVATPEELADALAVIGQAKTDLDKAKELGLTPDKVALDNAIRQAQKDLDGLKVSVDGSGVDSEDYWVTEAVRKAAQDGLDAARVLLVDEGATVDQVTAALDAISRAVDTVNGVKKPGKSDLADAISDAGETVDGLVSSVDGSDVSKDQYWVTQAAMDAVRVVVDEALGVLHDPAATPAEVAEAIQAVEDAVAGLDPKPGIQVDKSDVGDAIKGLEDALEDLAVSELDGRDVARDLYWVDPGEKAELVKVVEDAKSVYNDADATADEVAQAVKDIAQAVKDLEDMKEPGKLVDKAALESAVERAGEVLAGLTVSVDGSEVSPDVDWVTQGEKDAAQKAVDDAKLVLDKPGVTEAEIAGALDAIREALDTLDGAGQPGKSDLAGAIADAGKTLDGLKTSVDGSDVSKDQQWYAQSDVDAVQVVLDEADAVLHDPDATPAEVEAAIKAIEDGLAGLKPKPGTQVDPTPGPDKSGLESAIKGLEDALKDLPVSDKNGADVPLSQLWIDPGEKAELVKVVEDAKSVLDDPDATAEEVAQAVKDVEQAVKDLEGMKQPGSQVDPTPGPDKSGLESAVKGLEDALKDLTVSDKNGADVAKDLYWVDPGEKAELVKVVEDAKSVLNDPDATAEEIAQAVKDVEQAVKDLEDMKQPGSQVDPTPGPDKSGLEDALKGLEDALKDLAVSDKNGADVPLSQSWIDPGEKAELVKVVEDAKSVLNDPDATADEIAQAVKDIEKALEDLEGMKQPGTQVDPTPGPDKSGLEDALKGLEDALKDLIVSDKNGADVPTDESWIDPSEKAELVKVVEDAKSVLNDPDATADEIAQAVKDIAQAVKDLEDMKQPGSQVDPTPGPDKSGLESAVKGLEDVLKDLPVSDKNGADVPTDELWIDPSEKAELVKVVEDAKSVLDDPDATADEIAQAVKDIEKALEDLEGMKQPGSQVDPTPSPDKSGLESALDEAAEALADLVSSADGTDVSKDRLWVTSEAKAVLQGLLDEATALLADPNATQAQIDAMKTRIEAALADLLALAKPGTKPANPSGGPSGDPTTSPGTQAPSTGGAGVSAPTGGAATPGDGVAWLFALVMVVGMSAGGVGLVRRHAGRRS
jgi:uncharacterized protein YoxC